MSNNKGVSGSLDERPFMNLHVGPKLGHEARRVEISGFMAAC